MVKEPKIPNNEELLKLKTLYHQKRRDPIWIALEKEMRAKADENKPYNEKVGKWLKFMRSLIYHYYCTERKNYNQMLKDTGPPWFIEFSKLQISVLNNLKSAIHQDLLEDKTHRTAKLIHDLGITLIFPEKMLIRAMENSTEDPGIFFWVLYCLYYKVSPTELLPRYDENAMVIMSALVFVDLDECKRELLRITAKKPAPPPKPPKKPKKYTEPDVLYGQYLQKMYVPLHTNHPKTIPKPKKILPMKNKVKLRSKESYLELANSESFMEVRKERNMEARLKERKCNYKFWRAPRTLRNTDKGLAAYVLKLKMFKKRPKPEHAEFKAPFENIQYLVRGVSYSSGKPVYHLECIATIPTGYIPINGGDVMRENGTVLNILGYYRYPMDYSEPCDSSCDCLEKWNTKVKSYLNHSKCECHHRYDYCQEGKVKKKFFNPPKNNAPFWIDEAQVYQFDDWQDFIRDEFDIAMNSSVESVSSSDKTISASNLKEKELLSAFLAELAHSPLIIPHLPKANLLRNLQEFVRQHVKGKLKKRVHKDLLLKTKRQWLNLDHIDFNERAYVIPFPQQLLRKIKFCHRSQIRELSQILLANFEKRTRKSWLEHSRLFWTTMMSDAYPSQRFLDTFFTYMPARLMDTHVINPFSPDRTPRNIGKTCKLPKVDYLH